MNYNRIIYASQKLMNGTSFWVPSLAIERTMDQGFRFQASGDNRLQHRGLQFAALSNG